MCCSSRAAEIRHPHHRPHRRYRDAERRRLRGLAHRREDVQDIGTLRAAEAREAEIGKAAARADDLSDDLVGRLLDGEHPIRIWREHRGLTSQALADKAGVSCSYLAEIEGLKKPGSIQAFRSLATALGVAVDDLLFNGE